MKNILAKAFVLIIALTLSLTSSFAQKDIKALTLQAIEKRLHLNSLRYSRPVIINENDTVALIYFYKNGYLVLSQNTDFYPVKAYSTTTTLDTNSPYFLALYSILQKDYQLQQSFLKKHKALSLKNQEAWQLWASDKQILQDSIGPLLKSEYGQVNCKDENGNYIYVTNYYTPNHYAVGCVALALATTLRYYNWPITGQGSHTYTDDQGNSTGTYSVDYNSRTYQWSKIQDKYYKVPSTNESRRALGRVAFDAAVAVDMDFESDGSTSNINRIPSAVGRYFRYDIPKYRTKSSSDFWQLIDSSLSAMSPVELAVYTSSGAGHAIVCDGVKFTDDPNTQLYHLNMGWWGSSNGWYTIQDEFNAGGYSIVSAAVMGLLPIPELLTPNYDFENKQLIIKWIYPDKVPNASFQVQIKQNSDGEWQTVASDVTSNELRYPAPIDATYYVRVKETRNQEWSEEESISPQAELNKLKVAKVFPSLAYDHLYVQYLDLNNSVFKLYNNQGKLIILKKFSDPGAVKSKIDLPKLSTGLYFGQLKTQDTTYGFKIFILGQKPVSF